MKDRERTKVSEHYRRKINLSPPHSSLPFLPLCESLLICCHDDQQVTTQTQKQMCLPCALPRASRKKRENEKKIIKAFFSASV